MALWPIFPSTHFESDHCGDRSTQFSSLLNRKHEGQRVATRCLQSLRDFKSCLWLLFAIFPCQLPPSIDNLMILGRLKKLGSLIKNCTRTTHPNNLVAFSLNIETMKFTVYVRVMVNELFSLVICSSREPVANCPAAFLSYFHCEFVMKYKYKDHNEQYKSAEQGNLLGMR